MFPKQKILDVLIVDDSENIVSRIRELLSGLMCVRGIRTVATEVEALNTLKEFEAQVVLLDLHLKRGSGLGALRTISHSKHRPVIVAFTDHPAPQYREHALANGASYFLDIACIDSLPAVLESLCTD
jgi:CheY-like chemotaxis protein